MEITLNIEGMMCPHCEARVKKALEAIPEVADVLIDKDSFIRLHQQVLQLHGIVLCRVRFEDVRTTLVMNHIHLVQQFQQSRNIIRCC